MRNLDSGMPVFIQTWQEGLNGALFPSRVATVALGLLGAMGALLSITGIFGLAAYSLSRRMRELGIRLAPGANRRELLEAALGSNRMPGDIAGEVEASGHGATRFSPGDAVFGTSNSAFAEYVCAKQSEIAAKPVDVNFEQAASVPIAGLTALQALRDAGKIERG